MTIYSPRMEPKIRIEQQAYKPMPKVKSRIAGRLEIEHIEEVMDSLSCLPDFGFNNMIFNEDDEQAKNAGWSILWDFINS